MTHGLRCRFAMGQAGGLFVAAMCLLAGWSCTGAPTRGEIALDRTPDLDPRDIEISTAETVTAPLEVFLAKPIEAPAPLFSGVGFVAGLSGKGDKGEIHRRSAELLRREVLRWKMRGEDVPLPAEKDLAEGNIALVRVRSTGKIYRKGEEGFFDVELESEGPIAALRGGQLFPTELSDAATGRVVALAQGPVFKDSRTPGGKVRAVIRAGGRMNALEWRRGVGNHVAITLASGQVNLGTAVLDAVRGRFPMSAVNLFANRRSVPTGDGAWSSTALNPNKAVIRVSAPEDYWKRKDEFIALLSSLEITVRADPRRPLLVFDPSAARLVVLRTEFFTWEDPVNPWGTARAAPALLLATASIPGLNLNQLEEFPQKDRQRIVYRLKTRAELGVTEIAFWDADGGDERIVRRTRRLVDVVDALDRCGLRLVDIHFLLRRLQVNRQALDINLRLMKPDPDRVGEWEPYFSEKGMSDWFKSHDRRAGDPPENNGEGEAGKGERPRAAVGAGDFTRLLASKEFRRLRNQVSFRICAPPLPKINVPKWWDRGN